MAIMAMATVRKIINYRSTSIIALLPCFAISSTVVAGEWQFVPNFALEEIYTDNVERTATEKTSSLVSQAKFGLNFDYQSHVAKLSISAENNNLLFSHDSDNNNNYLTLDTKGQYYLWVSGPELIASANVGNINRNSANNGLADLLSGDTIQAENYLTGLRYNANSNTFSIESSVVYHINRYEDGIGEYDGVSATFKTNSGSNTRFAFWRLSSSFSTRNQDFSGETRTGEQYRIDAILGIKIPVNWSAYVRFYDEDFSGDSINQNQQTTASWGPGFRWLVSPHLMVDLTYNYVVDDTVSDDYFKAAIEWEPSARTSLTAEYSRRFFGESYNLDIKHKTKRLTNSISYDESLDVFSRNNYQQRDLGLFWCPSGIPLEGITGCFVESEQPDNTNYSLIGLSPLELIEGNEFSLNKSFSWASKLQLTRTSFAINTSASRREGLESGIINDAISTSLTIERKISGRSTLKLQTKYDNRIFDKNNPEGSRQKDYYRTISATYTKDLASSLSTHFTIQHINRDSNIERFTYDEIRAIINVTKEF